MMRSWAFFFFYRWCPLPLHVSLWPAGSAWRHRRSSGCKGPCSEPHVPTSSSLQQECRRILALSATKGHNCRVHRLYLLWANQWSRVLLAFKQPIAIVTSNPCNQTVREGFDTTWGHGTGLGIFSWSKFLLIVQSALQYSCVQVQGAVTPCRYLQGLCRCLKMPEF